MKKAASVDQRRPASAEERRAASVDERRASPVDDRRIERLLNVIAKMAGGDLQARAPISPEHDAIDALAFGLNLLGGELDYTLDGLRKARAEADQTRAAREGFFRNITHELRTPVTSILLVVEILRGPDVPEDKRRELADRIERSARALLRLVDQVMDLSRLQSGRLELACGPVSLEAEVREVLAAFDLEAERKSLQLGVTVAPEAPASIQTDAERLRQVLFNVVGNAVKFSDAGRVEVRLGRDVTAELTTIDVIDTGAGITKEDQAHLFEPFARGRAHADRVPGSGLGLALSRRLARALGGDLVLVESKHGRGSEFRLTLPMSLPIMARRG